MRVPSIDEYITKFEKLSNKVIEPKTTVPKTKYLAVYLDAENNTFSLKLGACGSVDRTSASGADNRESEKKDEKPEKPP